MIPQEGCKVKLSCYSMCLSHLLNRWKVMNSPRYPMLYQLNTRVRLTELSEKLGRAATLDDFTDAELDEIAAQGFDWVWLLSVWQTGTVAQKISRSNPEWKHDFELT